MRFPWSRTTLIALAALLAAPGFAGAATVYTQLNNEATQTVTVIPPFSTTVTSISSPYGAGVLSQQGGDWVVTFSPTSAFRSYATSTSTTSTLVDTDGKIDFTLTFDSPIVLTALLNEGGSWFTSGNGTVSASAIGVVIEAQDVINPEKITRSGMATFATDNTWSASMNLGTFTHAYSSFKFSIDNYLSAEADASASPSIADISKTSFSIRIPGGGGEGQPVPLPLASVSGALLIPFAMYLRKKTAR